MVWEGGVHLIISMKIINECYYYHDGLFDVAVDYFLENYNNILVSKGAAHGDERVTSCCRL